MGKTEAARSSHRAATLSASRSTKTSRTRATNSPRSQAFSGEANKGGKGKPEGTNGKPRGIPANKIEAATRGAQPNSKSWQKAAAQLVVGTAGAIPSVLPAVTGMGEAQQWGSALVEQVSAHLFPKASFADAQRGMFGFNFFKGNDETNDTAAPSSQRSALEEYDLSGVNGDASITHEAKQRYQKFLKQHPELLDGLPVNPYVLLGHPLSNWVHEELQKGGLETTPIVSSLGREGLRHIIDAAPQKKDYQHSVEAHPKGPAPIRINKNAPSIHWHLRDDQPGKPGSLLNAYLLWTDSNGVKHKIESFHNYDFAIKTNAEFSKHQLEANPSLVAIPKTFIEPENGPQTSSHPSRRNTGIFVGRDQLTSMPDFKNLEGYEPIPLPPGSGRSLNLLKNETQATDVIQFEKRWDGNRFDLLNAFGSLVGKTGAVRTTYQFDPSTNGHVLSNKIFAQTDFNRMDPDIFRDENFDLNRHFAQQGAGLPWT